MPQPHVVSAGSLSGRLASIAVAFGSGGADRCETWPDCPGPTRVLPAATSAILVDPIEAVAPRRMGRAPSSSSPLPSSRPSVAAQQHGHARCDALVPHLVWMGAPPTPRPQNRGNAAPQGTGGLIDRDDRLRATAGPPGSSASSPAGRRGPEHGQSVFRHAAEERPGARHLRSNLVEPAGRNAAGVASGLGEATSQRTATPHRTTRQRGRSRRDLEASDASLSGSPRTRHMAGQDMGGPPSPGGHGPRRDAIFDDTGQWWHRGATAEARRRPIRPRPGLWSVSARSNAACRLVAAARRSDPGRRSPSKVVGRGDRRRAASRSPWATRPWSWPGVERLRTPCACAARGPPGRPPRRARRESDRRRSPGSRAQ